MLRKLKNSGDFCSRQFEFFTCKNTLKRQSIGPLAKDLISIQSLVFVFGQLEMFNLQVIITALHFMQNSEF